jgi:hypothetical protein
MSADKRSVSTDALETLGMIHFREEKRDAIHLAVIPAEAGESLRPGSHVEMESGKAFSVRAGHGVGIVDPFIHDIVQAGARFWLVIYPRKITSLRHVWSHPEFPDELAPQAVDGESDAVRAAKSRIASLAEQADCSYQHLMDGAAKHLKDGSYMHFGFDIDYGWPDEEFWRCYSIVTGEVVDSGTGYFFTCSC